MSMSLKGSGMAAWIAYNVLAGVVAYLCGSIPTGYWMGKILRGTDIREHGSKSTGATNVLRTLGKGPALIALAIDLLKGVAAVTFARWLLGMPAVAASVPGSVDFDSWLSWMTVIAALLAVAGHSRSIFIRFTGGKSAATGLGVLLAVSWPVGLGTAICFIAVLAISRIVSVSSMLAAIAAVILMLILNQPIAFLVLAVVGAAYVVLRHKQNIHRLIAGAEPRIGQASRSDTFPIHHRILGKRPQSLRDAYAQATSASRPLATSDRLAGHDHGIDRAGNGRAAP